MHYLIKSTFTFLLVATVIGLPSCDDNTAAQSQTKGHDNITRVVLTLKATSTNGHTPERIDDMVAVWHDMDGAGGAPATADTIKLYTDIIYNGTITLADESGNTVRNLTSEIESEKNIHQFFYTISGIDTAVITREDFDTNSPALPLGLQSTILTFSKSPSRNGLLNVVLSHYDANSKSENRSSKSDFDVTFPVKLLP